jgi:hypothetical protein
VSDFIEEYIMPTLLCDELVAEFHSKPAHQANHTRGYSVVYSNEIDPIVTKLVQRNLIRMAQEYTSVYITAFDGLEPKILSEPWNIQKYEKNRYYSRWHCENNGQKPFANRVMAWMTYLNDVTDQGGTEFYYQNKVIQPKKGLTLLWPAYFTHTHRGISSATQEKYIATGWLEFLNTESLLSDMENGSDEDFFNSLDRLNNESH